MESLRDEGFDVRARRADWRAVAIASLAGAIVLLLVDMAGRLLVPRNNLDAFAFIDAAGALLVTPAVEPERRGPGLLVVGLTLHAMLSLTFGSLIVLSVRRLRAARACAFGTLAGIVLYVVNFHVLAHLFTSFLPLRGLTAALAHGAFGASAVLVQRLRRNGLGAAP